jgi:hypothetical protein
MVVHCGQAVRSHTDAVPEASDEAVGEVSAREVGNTTRVISASARQTLADDVRGGVNLRRHLLVGHHQQRHAGPHGQPPRGRGVHSSTSQINLSTFCGIRWVVSEAGKNIDWS